MSPFGKKDKKPKKAKAAAPEAVEATQSRSSRPQAAGADARSVTRRAECRTGAAESRRGRADRPLRSARAAHPRGRPCIEKPGGTPSAPKAPGHRAAGRPHARAAPAARDPCGGDPRPRRRPPPAAARPARAPPRAGRPARARLPPVRARRSPCALRRRHPPRPRPRGRRRVGRAARGPDRRRRTTACS